MIIRVSKTQKEKFIQVYKFDFEACLRSDGEVGAYYLGPCSAAEYILNELGIVDRSEFSKIQEEVQELVEESKVEG